MKEFLDKNIGGDKVIWAVLILLSMISVIVVYSATGSLAYKHYSGNTFKMLFSQILYSSLGLVAVFIGHKFSYKVFLKYSGHIYLAGVGLLAATLVIGASLNDGGRWLIIPGVNISVQPSEFAKVALMIFLASKMADNKRNTDDSLADYIKMLFYVLVVVGLIFKENFSTAAMVFMVSMLLLIIGGIKIKYIATTIGMAVIGMIILLQLSNYVPQLHRLSTWNARIERFISGDKEGKDPGNFQAEQAKIAVVTGGVIGKGPGNSTQKNFLPHPYSDFVFAIIVEEYGLIGAMAVIGLYLILAFRMGRIVKESKTMFPALMVAGITILFLAQSFINMGVCVGILPVTGQTLPLISKGGTSIIIAGFSFGIILSVSRFIEKDKEEADVALSNSGSL